MKYSKSTVFSIAPFVLQESKPGIYPGNFNVAACLDEDKPEMLVVSASDHLMKVGGQRRDVRVKTSSEEIAQSIVSDFLDGQLFTSPEAYPGICWLPGEVLTENFVETDLHKSMKATQKRWYVLIVKKTEDDWKKYHNSRVVTDQARFAVRRLGIPTPEWMTTEEIGENFNRCPACSTSNDKANAVCTNCRCILDSVKYKTLTFA
jgi:hypothetical protein